MPVSREELISQRHVLADFGEVALRCDNLQTILDEGCRLVSQALHLDLAKILEIDEADDTALIRAGTGWKPGTVGSRLSLTEQSSETFSLNARKPVITRDIMTETRFHFPQILRDHGVTAIVNAPIFLPGGKAYGLLQVDSRVPRDFDAEDIEFLRTYCAVLGPVIDRLIKIDELRGNAERFRLVVENAHGFAIILSDPDDIITDWFPGATEVFGWDETEMIGRPVAAIFTADDRETGIPEREAERAQRDGKSPNIRWHLTKGGGRVFVDGQTITLRHANGTVRGFLKIGQDLTERKLNEERQSVLLAELQHRVRNVLAMVAAIVKRADIKVSAREFRDRLGGRLAAMARTQALLTRTAGASVELASIVRDELAAQSADAGLFEVAGPTIMLSSKAAEVLTLAIHELATNAIKYGALMQPEGHVAVGWTLERRDSQDWVLFRWEEFGVENALDPDRSAGFGFELIKQRVPYELGGDGDLILAPDGLRCRIAFPLLTGDSILQTSAPPLP